MTTTAKNETEAADHDAHKFIETDAALSSRAENDLMNMLREGRHPAYRTLRCLGVTIGVRVRGENT